MKTSKLSVVFISMLLYLNQNYAQDFIPLSCEDKADIIINLEPYLNEYSPELIDEMIAYITPCADLNPGDIPKAHYARGILHLEKGDSFNLFGRYIERSYHHIHYAANQNYPPAAYHHAMNMLTNKYSTRGGSVTMLRNFEKTLTLGYKPDITHYALGYSKLKNLISNYSTDITPATRVAEAKLHFEQSNHPMATHWLAIMHYFGYGAPEDKTKALQMLSANTILNSQTLLQYLQSHNNDWIPISAEERLASLENFNTLTNADSIIGNNTTNYQGHFIEYDWTGKGVKRYIPITLQLKIMREASSYKEVRYELTLNGTKLIGLSKLRDKWGVVSLGFNPKLTLPPLKRLLQDHPDKTTLTYKFGALNLKETTIDNRSAMVAEVYYGYDDAMIKEFSEEIRQPLRMILYPQAPTIHLITNTASPNNTIQSTTTGVLDKNFATISPNPIVDKFTISFTLENTSQVQVAIYDFYGKQRMSLPIHKVTTNGLQTIHVNSDTLQSGTYIVQMIVDGVPYSKTVVKL